MTDYYELMQISPRADFETIHRVYRFLAARFHPDNPRSGDANQFHLIHTAYEVLNDPVRRAEYDAALEEQRSAAEPLSESVDFMDSLDGELNRRLAVLAVLYLRRRTMPDRPEVALTEIEEQMGFPRDYLDFTLWYLWKKGYIARADNGRCALTVEGVDFVEKERFKIPTLSRMLTSSQETSASHREPPVQRVPARPSSPPIAPSSEPGPEEGRLVFQFNRRESW